MASKAAPRRSAGESGVSSSIRRQWRFGLSFSLLLAGTPLLIGCDEPASARPAEERARPVQVATVAFRPVDTARSFVGVVRARREIDLSFRVGGKLVRRLVEVGDLVETGDLLADIDPEDMRLELESARAELAAAEANLRQTSAENERYRALSAKGSASVADRDRRQLARQEAVGRLERARRALDLAQNRLGYAELRADADGVVVARSAEPGQVVAAGQTIVRVALLAEKEAVVALPETEVLRVGEAEASVSLWADPARRIAATLRELSPQADPATRTYQARFSLKDAADVALGMTATVTLHPPGDRMAAPLPLAAVFDQGGGARVYVVDPRTARLELRPVGVAVFTQAAALVSEGLQDGEQVVALGTQTLEPGARVRVVAAK